MLAFFEVVQELRITVNDLDCRLQSGLLDVFKKLVDLLGFRDWFQQAKEFIVSLLMIRDILVKGIS